MLERLPSWQAIALPIEMSAQTPYSQGHLAYGTDEVIPIHGILCLPCKEAPPMASVRFTDMQFRPVEFLDHTSLTLDEFQQTL